MCINHLKYILMYVYIYIYRYSFSFSKYIAFDIESCSLWRNSTHSCYLIKNEGLNGWAFTDVFFLVKAEA